MKTRMMVVALLLTPVGAPVAWAGTTHWQVGTGNWSTGTNWNNGEPGRAASKQEEGLTM